MYSLIRYEENLKFNPLFNWKSVQVLLVEALHDLNVLGPSQDALRYSGFVEVYPFAILEYRTKDNYNSPMASVDFLQISLM